MHGCTGIAQATDGRERPPLGTTISNLQVALRFVELAGVMSCCTQLNDGLKIDSQISYRTRNINIIDLFMVRFIDIKVEFNELVPQAQ